MYTNLFILYYFQSTFVELIMMLYRADASSKQCLQINSFNINIKLENVISTATSTSIKTEPEEKEEIEKIMKN